MSNQTITLIFKVDQDQSIEEYQFFFIYSILSIITFYIITFRVLHSSPLCHILIKHYSSEHIN